MENAVDAWFSGIQRDLRPFADPGTSINYAKSGRWVSAEWLSRRKRLSASFGQAENDEIVVTFDGREMSYASFLASVDMSDLLGLAGMMLQQSSVPFFVETAATKQGEVDSREPALALLQASVASYADAITNVVFVTGDAGAGKTEVLRQLVRKQAEKYVRGEVSSLFLYVNAQGRALARLDEALATELQDLRANLTYHAVPSLARNGVLVPVIDGFDELLGVMGYEDAFSSLRRFLDDLDGRGHIIASARSTYYQQEFLSRTGRTDLAGQRLRIEPIDILPWGDAELQDYSDRRYGTQKLPQISKDEFAKRMTQAFASSDNRHLKTKPFFVAKTADLVLQGVSVTGGRLLEQLVEGYVERERSEKLLDRTGKALLTRDQILRFIQLVCEEMWVTETRSLESSTVRILAELAFPSSTNVAEPDSIVKERAPAMAFFSPAPGRDRIEFEHQLFFSFFLGSTISDAVTQQVANLYSALVRSALPEGSADFAASRLKASGQTLEKIAAACADACNFGVSRSVQVRENSGALVASYLRVLATTTPRPHGKDVHFQHLVFAGENFESVEVDKCVFEEVEFRRSDLSSARFLNCLARKVSLHEIVVDPQKTRLEFSGFDAIADAYGVKVRNDGGYLQLFRPDSVANVLYACGAAKMEEEKPLLIDTNVLDLIEKILRKYEKSNLFWPGDPENKQIILHPSWTALQQLLIESGVVKLEEAIPHKGSPRPALRRNFLPTQIMSGRRDERSVFQNVERFWKTAEVLFPASINVQTDA